MEDIIERFKDLGLVLDTQRLRKVQEIRNDIEHHASTHTEAKVREAVAKTFVLVVTVLEDHLGEKPSAVLSERAWQIMLSEAQTYKRLWDRCRRSIDALIDVPPWAPKILDNIECPSCGSELLEATEESYFATIFSCSVCGAESEVSPVIEIALAGEKFAGDYEAVTRGGEPTIGTCPSCHHDTFLSAEDVCAACGEARPFDRCARCDEQLGLDEQESGMCSYCDHMLDKLMRE